MSDKPWARCTRDELEHIGRGYEAIIQSLLRNVDALLHEWDALPESEKYDRVRRAFAPAIINLRPLPEDELAALRLYVAATHGNPPEPEA